MFGNMNAFDKARENLAAKQLRASRKCVAVAPPPMEDSTLRLEGQDHQMIEAERKMKWAERAIPFGSAHTGRKERNRPSCPDWVAARARVKMQELEKTRGKSKGSPHPEFLNAFPPECYAPGTLRNKMSHFRAAENYMKHEGKKGGVEAMRVEDWRDWGIKMSQAGVDWTVLSYYMGTVRAFLGWIRKWSLHEWQIRAQMSWEQVKKSSLRFRPSQAPVILWNVFDRLDNTTKSIVLFSMALGLRHSSLMSITNDHIMWSADRKSVRVQVTEFKWLPEGRGRIGEIRCACTSVYRHARPDIGDIPDDIGCIIFRKRSDSQISRSTRLSTEKALKHMGYGVTPHAFRWLLC